MKKALFNLLDTGNREGLVFGIAKRLRITNSYAFIFGGSCFLYGLLFLSLEIYEMGVLALGIAAAFGTVLLLNKFALYTAGRMMLLVLANLAIYTYATSLGRESGTHHWSITVSIVSFAIFDLRERRQLFLAVLLGMGNLFFIWLSDFSLPLLPFVPLSPIGLKLVSTGMVLLSSLTSLSIVFYVASNYQKVREKEVQSQRVIQNQLMALNASSIVAQTDAAGKITYANDNFCTLSGYSLEEIIGKTHSILNSGFHPPEFFTNMWKTIGAKKIWKGIICNKAKAGNLYWVDTTIVPILGRDDKIEGYIAVRHDITETKTLQASLFHASKMTALGEMAAGIAHEINNPLAIIQAKASHLQSLFQAGVVGPQVGIAVVERIGATTERIAKIIKALRSFSRNADKDPFERTDLPELMENLLGLCAERFKAHDVKLEMAPPPKLSLVCRPVQVEQVLLNLIGNAYDAVTGLPEKWVRIDFLVSDAVLLISVTDSGQGIPPEIVQNMMEPFFTTKEVGLGTGLGLSISKGIIESHHGRLRYDSSSVNTRFLVELPLRPSTNIP